MNAVAAECDLAAVCAPGREVTAVGPEVQRAHVIDLMDALKESIAKRSSAAGPARAPDRKPPAKVRQAPASDPATGSKPERRAQAGKK